MTGFFINLLNWINGLVGNYGWSIVLFTLIIRLVLLPLDIKSKKSMRAMSKVQPKLQAVRKAEPVLETKAEPVNKDNDIAEAALAGETVMEAPEVKSSAEPGKEEPAKINFPEAAKANAAAAAEEKSVLADKDSAPADEDLKPAADDKSSVSGSNGYGGKRKPLFSRFNPRSPMVFNRNGFPRKNADLRVALSELQKSAEPRLQSVKATPEPAGETVKPESQNSVPAPEGNKES